MVLRQKKEQIAKANEQSGVIKVKKGQKEKEREILLIQKEPRF